MSACPFRHPICMIVHEENILIRTENGGMTDVVWLFFVTLPIDNSFPCHVQLRIPSDGTLLAMALPLVPPSWLWCPLSICFPLHHRCGVRVVGILCLCPLAPLPYCRQLVCYALRYPMRTFRKGCPLALPPGQLLPAVVLPVSRGIGGSR